jgi:hypothetical protein
MSFSVVDTQIQSLPDFRPHPIVDAVYRLARKAQPEKGQIREVEMEGF